jgi:CubicO group peptidase (beta-lactamase class C family)
VAAGEPSGQRPGALEPELAEKIDAVFKKLDRRDSPGCALAVVRDGRIAYEKGYGMASLELGVPNTPDTVFDIGSTEKQFAAATILLLAQDGKLSIDDSIRKHVPELPRYADPVTIRHLLHHTGGLPDYISLMMLSGSRIEDVTTEEDALRALIRAKSPEFPPGAKHSYSNSGYFLLSVIVRRAAGKSLREFAEERIFRPLGMASTGYLDDHTQIVSRRSTGYSPRRGGGFRLDTSNWEQNGDGGLQTTVRDLAKWDQNFYAPAVGGAKLIEELQTTGTLSNGKKLEYAKGLRVDAWRGLKRVSHGGAWAGYRAQLVRFPEERISVICLCNLATAGPGGLANKVAELLLAGKLAPEEKKASAPTAGGTAPSAEEISRYSGLYWNRETDDLRRVEGKDGKLFLRQGEDNQNELQRVGPGLFRLPDAPISVEVRFPSPGTGGPARMEIVYEDDDSSLLEKVAETSPSAEALPDYAGTYENEELEAKYVFRVEKDRLLLYRRGADEAPLKPLFTDGFQDEGIGLLRFLRDGSRVTGFEVSAGGKKLRFEKRKG